MSVELEWTVIDEDYRIEPDTLPPSPRRSRSRTVLIAGLTLIALIIVTALVLRHRIAQNQRQLKTDIQALLDLEAQMVANGDRELFLSLQSQENAAWYEWRGIIFDHYAQTSSGWPRLKVTHVIRVGDHARVHATGSLAEVNEQFDWVLFYHLQNGIWRQVAPDAHYWGPEREREMGQFHFVYHERDEPYLEPIAERLAEMLHLICDDLGCSVDTTLTIQLAIPNPHSISSATNPTTLVLPSPSTGPYPTLTSQPALISRVSYTLVPYLAFEVAGGEGRWQGNLHGAWYISAVIQWTQERLWQRLHRVDARSPFASSREFLRLIVYNSRVPPLEQIWYEERVITDEYPALIQSYGRSILHPRAHALTTIDYIAETYGAKAIPDFLSAVAKNDTLGGALQDALGVSLGEFEPTWLAWLQAHYGDEQLQ